MAQQTATEREWSADELADAGASRAFIIAYNYDYGGRHSIRQELESGYGGTVLRERPEDFNPSIGGHFFEALWEGDTEAAWRRADGNNREIMREAGIRNFYE